MLCKSHFAAANYNPCNTDPECERCQAQELTDWQEVRGELWNEVNEYLAAFGYDATVAEYGKAAADELRQAELAERQTAGSMRDQIAMRRLMGR